MSMHAKGPNQIPEETVRIAKAVFRKGNLYLTLRDELGVLYEDEEFRGLFSLSGKSAESPGFLALVTVMQFVENLTDRQAAEAVKARIDWKYALGLALEDEGFDYSVLSEFRGRLRAGQAAEHLFQKLLEVCRERGWVKARGKQRTDSTYVLAAVRDLNRLECVGETVRHALEVLVEVAPEWLRTWLPPEWAQRYAQALNSFHLPKSPSEREALGQQIGRDGYDLLQRVYASASPVWLREVPAVERLRRIWIQQYLIRDGAVRWRETRDLPPGERLIRSPYDPEARTSAKRTVQWYGYQVHLTETCDAESPHLVTQVLTTPATTPDGAVTAEIHDYLAEHQLSPGQHLMDMGYTDAAEFAHAAQEHHITSVGPMRAPSSWQARQAQGYALEDFHIDWLHQHATCPQGHRSQTWRPSHDRFGKARISTRFPASVCRPCPAHALCTHAAGGERKLSFYPQTEWEALAAARAYQVTPEFKKIYALRAGIEGTFSAAVSVFGLRLARYRGLAKTSLQHFLTATAMNYVRIGAWLMGAPRAATRPSKLLVFAGLSPSL